MNFNKYLENLNINHSNLTDSDIINIEKEVGFILPDDYKNFIKTVNGCEGFVNNQNYIIFWKSEDIGKYNREYQVVDFINEILLFGSDGAGEAFAFDRLNGMSIVRVPFVGMDRELVIPLSNTFSEFLELLYEKDIYEL